MKRYHSVSSTIISTRHERPPKSYNKTSRDYYHWNRQACFIYVLVFGVLEIKPGWLVFHYSGLKLPTLSTEFRHDILLYKTRNTIAHPSIKVTTLDSKTDMRENRRFLEDSTGNRTICYEFGYEDNLSNVSSHCWWTRRVPETDDRPHCKYTYWFAWELGAA